MKVIDIISLDDYDIVRTFHGDFEVFGKVEHIEISRKDNQTIHDWKELQAIKEKIFGDTTAIEIYPCRADTVDNTNAYHLWTISIDLPFGLHKIF